MQLLYRDATVPLAFGVLLAVFLVALLWPDFTHARLLGWLMANLAASSVRALTVAACNANTEAARDPTRWINRFAAGAALSGAVWGSTLPLFGGTHSEAHLLLAALWPGGVAAGTVVTFSVSRRVFLAFVIPALLTGSIYLIGHGGELYIALAAGMLAYLAFICLIGLRMYKGHLQQIALTIHNEQLAESMLAKNKEIADLNHRLQDLLQQRTTRLAATETKYRMLFDNASDAIFLFQDFRCVDCNNKAMEMYGCSREELLSRMPAGVAPELQPDGTPSIEKAHALIDGASAGMPQHAEYQCKRTDGTTFETEVGMSLVSLPEGDYVQAIVRDVTKRKKAEEEVQASRDLLKSVVENAPISVFWKGTDLRYLGSNSIFAQAAGMSCPEDLIGKDDYQLAWHAQAEIYRADDRRIMESDTPKLGYEEPLTTPDGRAICVRTSKVPLHNSTGNVIGVLGIYEDITERKRAETALRASHQRLLDVIDRLPFGMAVAADEGLVAEFINQAFTKITGYGIEEVPSFEAALQRLIPEPERRAAVNQDLQAMLAEAHRTKQPSAPRTYRLRHQDGSLRDLELQFVDLDGLAVWTFRDVTEHLRAAQRIQRLTMLMDALSSINRAIVRVRSNDELFMDACAVAVGRAGCLGAWIGVLDKQTYAIRPVAASGIAADDGIREGTHMDPEASPAGGAAAVRTKVREEFENISGARSWDDFASRYGIGAAAAFPLRDEGALKAVLTVYYSQVDAFDEETVALIDEMAEDISFALGALRSQHDREIAEQGLLESEKRFRAIVEQTISGVYIIGPDLQFIYVNPRLAEIFGYASNEEVARQPVTDLVAPEARELVTTNLKQGFSGEAQTMRYDFPGMRKDGSHMIIGTHSSAGTYQGKKVVIGALQDVTEVRRAEEQLREYVARLERTTESTIEIIATIGEMRDPYTRGHERRVGELAAAIGAEMGLEESRIEGLRVIGHLHDVGKIGIPAEILSKPTKLSPAEFKLIKEHPQQGYQILKGYDFPWPVAEAVLQHHERMDGSGYPRGLKGTQIMLEARILAVADTVEAMSSHRPYRPGLGLDAALAQVEKGIGTIYDPAVARACLRLFRDKGYEIPA